MRSTVRQPKYGAIEGDAGKQVTIGDTTFKLDRFLVLATQNPIEQEGTYQLPEASRSFC
jgi:MoxR-like ATPase